jgi:hypothetical protein
LKEIMSTTLQVRSTVLSTPLIYKEVRKGLSQTFE